MAYRVTCAKDCGKASGVDIRGQRTTGMALAPTSKRLTTSASRNRQGRCTRRFTLLIAHGTSRMPTMVKTLRWFFMIDGDESSKDTYGISGKYSTQSLSSVCLGGYPDHGPMVHFTEQYIGEVLIFDSKLTDEERETVTCELMRKWTKPEPFADKAALKTAVDNCLDVAPYDGVACCATADCGPAGTDEMQTWDVSQVTDMSELFRTRVSSTRISRRGIPRRSRTWCTCSVAPPRSTKTSDRGIPRRSRTW